MVDTESRKASRKKYDLNNPKKVWAKYANKDARRRAIKKNVPHNITNQYIESILTDYCPVYGTEFMWCGNVGVQPTSPSLDRIDPVKGYVEGNVVVISIKANNIKSAYKAADLYKVADWLYEIEKGLTNGN